MDNDQLAYALLLQQPNGGSTSPSQQVANASLAALQSTLLGNAAAPPQPGGALQQAMAAMDLLKLLQTTDGGMTSSGDHTQTSDLRSNSIGGGGVRGINNVIDDKTAQQKMRAQKNREAAARSRQRAKQFTDELQQRVKELTGEVAHLQTEVKLRDAKIAQLMAVIDSLKGSVPQQQQQQLQQ